MMKLKAVLFDMDGVIVDTELEDHRIQVSFVKKLNREAGYLSDGLDFKALVGKSYGALREQLCLLTGNRLAPEALWARFLDFDRECRAHIDYASLYRAETEEMLDVASRFELKTAVVSSSPMRHIEEVLTACGVCDRFDLIVSGESVARSKPDPTIYRNTLQELGFAPGECVAIEDSTYGIAAALGAGIPVIAYEEKRVPIDQSAATWVARDLSAAAAIVRRMASGE